MVTEQLTLRFGWGEGFGFDNYYALGNEAALHCVRELSAVGGEQFVYLWGAPGSGKSHLLQAACQAGAQSGATVAYLPLQELREFGPGVFEGLEQMALVCLDDVQLVAGQAEWEDALFHLYNRLRETGSRLLVTATASPLALGIKLADLRSRLAWGPVFQLAGLDDSARVEALRLHAAARGFDLPDEVAEFLMRRAARDMNSLYRLLDKLDQASLAQQRKLTIPFVRQFL